MVSRPASAAPSSPASALLPGASFGRSGSTVNAVVDQYFSSALETDVSSPLSCEYPPLPPSPPYTPSRTSTVTLRTVSASSPSISRFPAVPPIPLTPRISKALRLSTATTATAYSEFGAQWVLAKRQTHVVALESAVPFYIRTPPSSTSSVQKHHSSPVDPVLPHVLSPAASLRWSVAKPSDAEASDTASPSRALPPAPPPTPNETHLDALSMLPTPPRSIYKSPRWSGATYHSLDSVDDASAKFIRVVVPPSKALFERRKRRLGLRAFSIVVGSLLLVGLFVAAVFLRRSRAHIVTRVRSSR